MSKNNFDMANQYLQQLLEEQVRLCNLYENQKSLLPSQTSETEEISKQIADCKAIIKEYAELYGRAYSFAVAKTVKDTEIN